MVKGKEDYWNTGMLINIRFENNIEYEIEYLPVKRVNEKVRLMKRDEAGTVLEQFKNRSVEILKDGFVDSQFISFVNSLKIDYFAGFTSRESLLFRCLNKLSRNNLRKLKYKFFYPKEKLLTIQNFVECESHREVLVQLIKNCIDS